MSGAVASTTSSPKGLSPGATHGVVAKFGNVSIRLHQGWGVAKSCVVYAGGETECFESNEAADANLIHRGLVTVESFAPNAGERAVSKNVSILPSCADGWLCVWENSGGGGRRLIFRDESLQWLGNYGFQYKISSYRNRQDDGSGYLKSSYYADSVHYPLDAYAYVSYIGDMWNDKADYIHP